MDNLIPFDYHGKEVRTVTLDGEPWFIAKDVCGILDIINPSDAVKRLDEDERSSFNLGRQGETNIISESGLYSLILGSKKPEAKPFKRWVVHDVIPSIRKTGGYVSDSSKFIESYFPQLGTSQKSVLNTMLEETRKMGEKIKTDAPKVLFADSVAGSKGSILIRDMAKLLKQNGVEIGETRLFEWLRSNGYLIRAKGRDYNSPTQKSMELKIMEKKVTTISPPDREPIEKTTTLINGKGQQYFINKFAKIMAEIKSVD